MAMKSEEKSAFRAVALASGFLHEAEKLGLTPELLQRLRESPRRMSEVVSSAKQAQADHFDRIRRLQYEKECAVDIDGVHYHLVLITRRDLADWGCKNDGLVSDAVKVAERHNFEPLCEEAFAGVERVLQTVTSTGQWIGAVQGGGPVLWERTACDIGVVCSYGSVEGMPLSQFPELRGMVFMQKFLGCDFNPANQS